MSFIYFDNFLFLLVFLFFFYSFARLKKLTFLLLYSFVFRCDSSELRLSRRQKRVLQACNKYLFDGTRPIIKKNSNNSTSETSEIMDISGSLKNISDTKVNSKSNLATCLLQSTSSESSKDRGAINVATVSSNQEGDNSKVINMSLDKNAGESILESNLAPRKDLKSQKDNLTNSNKAKHIRMKKSIEKIMEKTNCTFESAREQLNKRRATRLNKKGNLLKTLEDRMTPTEGSKHQITLKFVSTSLNPIYFEEKVLPVEFQVYRKYQCHIHKDEYDECTMKRFKRFLFDSPLVYEPFPGNNRQQSPPYEADYIPGYGSYHMQYWLDGKILIGVSVIDITTYAFSSVYFFYDPDYQFLTLGTLSALNELKQVRILSQKVPQLKYYYMGYYIDSCQKMRYKKQFKPSFLLCPETMTWHKMDDALPKLHLSKYARLHCDPNVKDANEYDSFDYSEMRVTLKKTHLFTMARIMRSIDGEDAQREIKNEVDEYVSVAGKQFARTVIYYLPI